MHKAKQGNPVNASLTTIAAASVVAIMMLMISSYFVAISEEVINAYGQLTHPPSCKNNSKEEE